MRRPLDPIVAGALILASLLAGCGSTAAKIVSIDFISPAVPTTGKLPTLYTCAGRNAPLPLEWGAVPANAAELVVFALGLTPTPSGSSEISVLWAAAGLKPTLHRIVVGDPPPGARVGLNNAGNTRFSLCPAKGTSHRYLFVLYSLPTHASAQQGFQGIELLGHITSNLPRPSGRGEFAVEYERA